MKACPDDVTDWISQQNLLSDAIGKADHGDQRPAVKEILGVQEPKRVFIFTIESKSVAL